MTDLKHTIVSLFQDQSKSFDEIIGLLGVLNTQYVDTMASLRKGQIQGLDLNNHIIDKLNSVYDLLAMKSGRRITTRKDFLKISPEEIRFVQNQPIGSGSFGNVYLGIWQGEKVAIKRASDAIKSDDIIKMIQHEAEIWFPLKHKNVLPLWGAGLDTDKPFLVMPFVENSSLFDFLSRWPDTPVKQRVKFACDIAYGLEYLHKSGVVHGDLKADNVLVGNYFLIRRKAHLQSH